MLAAVVVFFFILFRSLIKDWFNIFSIEKQGTCYLLSLGFFWRHLVFVIKFFYL